jgi:ectoine hydroxylase-related dioxygenase (phytanoyl-CoA dioxygenase family)
MPASHLEGPLIHDLEIGKRHVPRAALGREIRLVEMSVGDLLIFHSHLVHSSNLNVSESVRYSVQARFVPTGGAVDAGMGNVTAVGL